MQKTYSPNLIGVGSNTILIVDDDPLILDLLKMFLEELGQTCAVADDGRVALGKLRQEHFDLVLSDISMPNMDGLELLKQVKTHHPHTDVVIMTGYYLDYDFSELYGAGVFDLLMKPFGFSVVKDLLLRLTESKKRRATENSDQSEVVGGFVAKS